MTDFDPPTKTEWPQLNEYWTWKSSQPDVIYYVSYADGSFSELFNINTNSVISYTLSANPTYSDADDGDNSAKVIKGVSERHPTIHYHFTARNYFIAGKPGTTTLTLSHFSNIPPYFVPSDTDTPDRVLTFQVTVPEDPLKVNIEATSGSCISYNGGITCSAGSITLSDNNPAPNNGSCTVSAVNNLISCNAVINQNQNVSESPGSTLNNSAILDSNNNPFSFNNSNLVTVTGLSAADLINQNQNVGESPGSTLNNSGPLNLNNNSDASNNSNLVTVTGPLLLKPAIVIGNNHLDSSNSGERATEH